jgi:hypothetical protein
MYVQIYVDFNIGKKASSTLSPVQRATDEPVGIRHAVWRERDPMPQSIRSLVSAPLRAWGHFVCVLRMPDRRLGPFATLLT